MKNSSLVLIICLVFLAVATGVANSAENESISLSGGLSIGAAVDKRGVPKPGASHYHFRITGEAAKTMFKSIPGKAAVNDCTGFLHKQAENLNCYAKTIEQQFECNFSIDVNNNKLASSSACD